MTLTDEVRSFNRFYTREIGLLNRSLPATDLSLPEARVLYELLLPWTGRNIVMGGTGCWGSSDRFLGLLAGVQGHWSDAERHFMRDRAPAVVER